MLGPTWRDPCACNILRKSGSSWYHALAGWTSATCSRPFELGFDAVFVSGCHEGDCHYLAGNIRAKKRVNKLKKDLDQCWIN